MSLRCYWQKSVALILGLLVLISYHSNLFAQLQEGFPLSTALWHDTRIEVCWENPGNWTKERDWVRDSVSKTWQQNSLLAFSGWGSCDGVSSINLLRVRIQDGPWRCGTAMAQGPHTCGLGKNLNKKPNGVVLNFSFQKWAASCQGFRKESCIRAIGIHEFGHAIGFTHEQNRPDTPVWCKNKEPKQGTNGDILIGSWDKDSVMNYCAGYRTELSAGDIKSVQTLYGNPTQRAQSSPNLFVAKGSQMRAVWSDGLWIQLGPAAWSDTTSMANLDSRIFAIQNDRIHEINLRTGMWRVVGNPKWGGPTKMTAIGRHLYVVQNDRLHKVNPENGSYQVLGGADWPGTTSMARLGGGLFIIQNDRLHKVNPGNGSYQVLGGADWPGITSMVGLGRYLYVIQNDRLHKVNPGNGSYQVLGGADWPGITSMASGNGRLYAIQNMRLHKVNPENGSYQVLGGVHWDGKTSMAVADD